MVNKKIIILIVFSVLTLGAIVTIASGEKEIQPQDIFVAQTELKRLNLYYSKIDGVWGRGSSNAISEFQRQKNIEVDGLLSHKLIKNLKRTSETEIIPLRRSVKKQPISKLGRLIGNEVRKNVYIAKGVAKGIENGIRGK